MNYSDRDLINRVIELESQIVKLNTEKVENRKIIKRDNSVFYTYATIFVPVALIALILMGLEIKYQTEHHQITYNNGGLIELGLSGITLLSGLYSIKKYNENERKE